MSEMQAFLHQSQVCDLSTSLANTLPDMQSAFVSAVVSGRRPDDAAADAGYSEPRVDAYRLMKSPAVLAAVHEGVQRELAKEAPASLQVLRKIRDDDNAPARVRADISVKIMQMAGHITPRSREDGPQKALSEMTQSELIAFIDANQAAIDRAADELMAKAKDISPGAGVTVNVPKQGATQAKATDYLD